MIFSEIGHRFGTDQRERIVHLIGQDRQGARNARFSRGCKTSANERLIMQAERDRLEDLGAAPHAAIQENGHAAVRPGASPISPGPCYCSWAAGSRAPRHLLVTLWPGTSVRQSVP